MLYAHNLNAINEVFVLEDVKIYIPGKNDYISRFFDKSSCQLKLASASWHSSDNEFVFFWYTLSRDFINSEYICVSCHDRHLIALEKVLHS